MVETEREISSARGLLDHDGLGVNISQIHLAPHGAAQVVESTHRPSLMGSGQMLIVETRPSGEKSPVLNPGPPEGQCNVDPPPLS